MFTVYIDLDDTLLNGKKRISDYTYNVLTEFQSCGNNIVFATARSRQMNSIDERIRTLTPHFILHNGGETVSGGKVIHQDFFDREEAGKIGVYLTENSIRTAVILDDAYYANYDAPSVWGEIKNFHFTDFSNADFCAPKFSVLIDEKKQMRIIDALENRARITYIDNGSGAIIAPKNASKGAAVKLLREKLFCGGTSIFIGNDYNDISGFESCDIKVAVANAERALIERADIIIESNENDGVAHYLEELMRPKNA